MLKKLQNSLLLALLLSSFSAAGWADSRSATIRISCSVAPVLEITRKGPMAVRSNLQDRYQTTETQVERDGKKIKVISLTAR